MPSFKQISEDIQAELAEYGFLYERIGVAETPILFGSEDVSREGPFVLLLLREQTKITNQAIPWEREAYFKLEACVEFDEPEAESTVFGLSNAIEKAKEMLTQLLEENQTSVFKR